MAVPGWYADPGGQPGKFRYWDGSAWSTELASVPGGPPPAASTTPPPRRRWLVPAVVAVLVAVALLISLLTWLRPSAPPTADPTGPEATGTQRVCPKLAATLKPAPTGDPARVYGGRLSYPKLAGWTGPIADSRVPFANSTSRQEKMFHENYVPRQSWVSSVTIAELVAGDGFYAPAEGAEIVSRCIRGTFYDDHKLTYEPRVSEPMTVDGRPAHRMEFHLGFDIPGLRTKGELAILVIVATSETSSSLFYASIPDGAGTEAEARAALAGLRVEG